MSRFFWSVANARQVTLLRTATNTKKIKGQPLCLVLWQRESRHLCLSDFKWKKSEQMWMGCSCLFWGIHDPRDVLREQILKFPRVEMGKRWGPLYLPFRQSGYGQPFLPAYYLTEECRVSSNSSLLFHVSIHCQNTLLSLNLPDR